MEFEPSSVWGDRWTSCDSPMAKKYMTIACQKRSIVCLAADRNTLQSLGELIEQVGPYISALKTHVDLVDDWTPEGWAELCDKARQANLLIFEDRKFADIGGITRNQMAGIYDIRSWSDLVTAHYISGPDIVDGLQSAWEDVGRKGGVLLLAQMSSRGNLLNPDYTKTVVDNGKALKGVFGFIGNGSRPRELANLREIVGPTKMIWTPGVNLAVGDGNMGQRYGDPREAVIAGSDTIIVGSGIHRSDNPEQSAKMYAAASWNALLERNNR